MFIDTIIKLYEIAVSKLAGALKRSSAGDIKEATKIKTCAKLGGARDLRSYARSDELKVKAAQRLQRAGKLKNTLADDNNGNGIPDIVENTLDL